MPLYDQIRDQFWPNGPRPGMWAVLDGAREPAAISRVRRSGMQHQCLFAGDLPVALERVAPYLVQLEHDDSTTRHLIDDGFGKSRGIFLKADLGIKTVREHLRKILRVRSPYNSYALFRYWDPRVLRVYLPTCVPNELDQFFGPIEEFWAEDDEFEERIVRFARKSSRLVQVDVPVLRQARWN